MIGDAEIFELLKDALAARNRGDRKEAIHILRTVVARIERRGSRRTNDEQTVR
jgi:hypothetical protein